MKARDEKNSLEKLLEQICQERGLDLCSYKKSFLQRRLNVRLRARECPDYAAYGHLLRQDPEEYGPLLEALSINLTRFFRDSTTFWAIEEKVLPDLLEARASQRRLRIWSAGCSAGEEPYSLAILLRENMRADLRSWRIEILATDMDQKALELAPQGTYDAFSFRDLSPRYREWVERYFTPGPKRQLAAEVRSMVTFRYHDLVHNPPPSQDLDLLLCRNVLIYFDRDRQEKLYQAFHQALRPGGFLVLGKTEVLPMAWSRHFPSVDLREHIYRRTDPGQAPADTRTSRRGDDRKRVRR